MENIVGDEDATLIIAGDLCADGDDAEAFRRTLVFLAAVRHRVRHLVVIAGNHDGYLQGPGRWAAERQLAEAGVTYLCDSGAELDGVKFYGVPWTADDYGEWSWQLPMHELAKKFSMIPGDTDVLITHCPPYGIRDASYDMVRRGNKPLLQRVSEVNPAIHVFGHIHEASGVYQAAETLFVNAGVMLSVDMWSADDYLLPLDAELFRNSEGKWMASPLG